ncbi:hypothetical protein [Novosphingobium cyanobacteriorum]|uniref:Uncharacterized protein n=1 Tax=Novosphingobium cyanobacteriorum TaxID=3024215 RepID=A0ABT6CI95_9SPHN|nr:hypothetical protein [Novosphingobium cyanobacteriorum]MDF8333244.1 hypothetical protein [Novosphingobium cyanobacteriorum]
MRPTSIDQFEKLYLGASVFGLLNFIFNFDEATRQMAQLQYGIVFLVIAALVGLGINMLFWFFIARRASNVAKWILTVLTAFGLVSTGMRWQLMTSYSPLRLTLSLLVLVLQVIAVAYLFRADAVIWLKSKGRQGPVDVATFE